MTYINIIAGFLNAGKTTFINQLCHTVYQNEDIYVLQNEDGKTKLHFEGQKDVRQNFFVLRQGCLCCSKTGEFEQMLEKVLDDGGYEQMFIEAAGTARLSDLIPLIRSLIAKRDNVSLGFVVFVVEAGSHKQRMRLSEHFYISQLHCCSHIYLTGTEHMFDADTKALTEELCSLSGSAALLTEATLKNLKDFKTTAPLSSQIAYHPKNQIQKQKPKILSNMLVSDFDYHTS